jgi:hypothetical protein
MPLTAEAVAGPDGAFLVKVKAIPEGVWQAEVEVSSEGKPVQRETRELLVETRDPETAVAAPNVPLMKALAAATGGTVRFIPEASMKGVELPDRSREVVDKKSYRPLWDTWKVLLFISLLLAAEWALRRRWGQQ